MLEKLIHVTKRGRPLLWCGPMCWTVLRKHKIIYICFHLNFIMEGENLFMPHSQDHSCWWPGDTRSQGISRYGIDLVLLKYSTCNTSVVNSHRSASPRLTTLEEDWELFVDFSSSLCLWFEIQAMRTYNFFYLVSNTVQHLKGWYHCLTLMWHWYWCNRTWCDMLMWFSFSEDNALLSYQCHGHCRPGDAMSCHGFKLVMDIFDTVQNSFCRVKVLFYWNAVMCHYNMVQYSKMLHKLLQELRQNINQMLNSQKKPHTLP